MQTWSVSALIPGVKLSFEEQFIIQNLRLSLDKCSFNLVMHSLKTILLSYQQINYVGTN